MFFWRSSDRFHMVVISQSGYSSHLIVILTFLTTLDLKINHIFPKIACTLLLKYSLRLVPHCWQATEKAGARSYHICLSEKIVRMRSHVGDWEYQTVPEHVARLALVGQARCQGDFPPASPLLCHSRLEGRGNTRLDNLTCMKNL